MSPIIRTVSNNLSALLSVMGSVDIESSDVFSDMRIDAQNAENQMVQLNNILQRMVGNLDGVRAATDSAREAQDQYNSSVQHLGGINGRILGGLKSLAKAYIGVRTIKLGVEVSDEMSQNEARLNMMNDGKQSTETLKRMVYGAAEASRGDYSSMVGVVAKLGNLAADAFGSSQEVIAFAEQLNKQYILAGASADEIKNSTLQLTQALSSGVLRGDELNSVFEQAPTIIRSIADYLNVSMGEIRGMASNGEITADIVKAAMFAAADETNKKFQSMPMTWQQIWIKMKNMAIVNMQPVLKRISDMAQNPEVQNFMYSLVGILSTVAKWLVIVFQAAIMVANVFIKNWSWIGPLVLGIVSAILYYRAAVAAVTAVENIQNMIRRVSNVLMAIKTAGTWAAVKAILAEKAAQLGLNAVLMANPVFWVIGGLILLIAVIGAVVGALNHFAGTSISVVGVVTGAFAVAGAAIYNTILGAIQIFLTGIQFIGDVLSTFAEFLGNIFKDPIGAIIHLFGGLADACLGILEGIASALDFVFGSHLADTVSGWRSKLGDFVDKTAQEKGNGEYEAFMPSFQIKDALSEYGIDRIQYKDAYQAGYAFGEDLLPGMDGMGWGAAEHYGLTDYRDSIDAYLGNIQDDTSSISDSMDITEDELVYLKDIAGQRFINQFTTLTPTMKVSFGDVHETADANKLFEAIETMTEQALASALI